MSNQSRLMVDCSGLNSTSGGNKKSVSVTSRKSETAGGYNADYQSDDSILDDRADNSVTKSSGQRRSKSEESLLERAQGLRQVKESSRSRRSSPLSHSGSVNQHLGRAGAERCSDRCSHSRERDRSDDPAAGVKSRIPLPVRILPDKEDLSSSGGDSHYMASPEPAHTRDSHLHSYVSSRYSDRYQPSSYVSSYNPSHLYTDYTVYGGYRPTSAKDYTRYNYYSTLNPDPESFLSGPTSPRWRRRSYDHDSDYLRYQRRTSARTGGLSDYPQPQPAATSTQPTSALTRSRSRSRVSDSYDGYRTSTTTGAGAAPASDSPYYTSYNSRPSSSYLYGHSYSNYHEGGLLTDRESSFVQEDPAGSISMFFLEIRSVLVSTLFLLVRITTSTKTTK